jgi:uncharacterized protein YqeY
MITGLVVPEPGWPAPAADLGCSRMTRSTALCAVASVGRRRHRHRRGKMDAMAALKDRLRSDLTAAMKARDEVTVRTLRMALTSVTREEVAGATARELSDDEVLTVLTREAKRRREAADAFAAAGRDEQAAAERAEGAVLDAYLPAQLGDAELGELVTAAIEETGASTPRDMGQVMKVLTPRVAGRAQGGRVAAEVRRRLQG